MLSSRGLDVAEYFPSLPLWGSLTLGPEDGEEPLSASSQNLFLCLPSSWQRESVLAEGSF